MRPGSLRILFGGASLALFAYGFSACTAITLGEWSGYTDGSDGGSNPNGVDASTACNPAFLAKQSTCGSCMNTNCSTEIAAVCTIDAGRSTPWADDYILPCAKNPAVNSYECNTFLRAADAAISPSPDPDALKSNVTQCIKGSCYNDCRRCAVTYPGCNGKSVTLGTEKNACGDCIVSQCAIELANACSDLFVDPIATCAGNSTVCVAHDCTKLLTGDAGSVSDKSKAVYACIRNNCTGSGQCQ